MALLSLEAIRDGVRTDPSLHFQNLDLARQAVLVLKLDESAIRAASFLDDRILSPQSLGRWTPIAELAPLMEPAAPRLPLHFIFHSGHVGSTLLSRLLDGVDGVLNLREPMPLRTLATAHGDIDAPHGLVGLEAWTSLLTLHLASWGRGFATTRQVIVKATSSAAQCAMPILSALPGARAVHLNLKPEPYLATLLAGENSHIDLRGHAPERMRRLARLAPSSSAPLHALSLGEIAAMTWAVESLTRHAAQGAHGERLLSVDFDSFLSAPEDALREICAHFGLTASQAYFDGVARSPVLTRYSKAPEHAYSPDLRRQILAASRAQHATEISRGMRWLETAAAQSPALGALLSA